MNNAAVVSTHPAVHAILSGQAPRPASLAAARGMLPLPQADLLEILVGLSRQDDEELSEAAHNTLLAQPHDALAQVAQQPDSAPSVLDYLASRDDLSLPVYESLAQNPATPAVAITFLAQHTTHGALLDLITINQQRLLATPALMDAVLLNPARTPDAERRVRELQEEFFAKEHGAQRIADELRARGQKSAANFVEEILASETIYDVPPEGIDPNEVMTADDLWLLAEYIEVDDDDIDESWLDWGMLEALEESDEQRNANIKRIIDELHGDDENDKTISWAQKILRWGIKKRVKYAMKGNREVRSILIRDSNKLVSGGVIRNPRITDKEVEAIAAMRSVSDEALRLIGMNRSWARNYPVIHNLARNPRTPPAIAMSILPRLHQKDLENLSKSRNIPDGTRRQAQRVANSRKPH